MAKYIDNKTGFKIIEVSYKEITSWEGFGICDHCNEKINLSINHFYIPVLNHCVCPKCKDEWERNAKFYPEDLAYQAKNIEWLKKYCIIEGEEDLPRLIIYVLYDHPSDFPNHFLIRRHFILGGRIKPEKGAFIVSNDLDFLRQKLKKMDLICIPRDETDDPVIIESWI